jgi:negative regulator of flagellin synthesis FlgM
MIICYKEDPMKISDIKTQAEPIQNIDPAQKMNLIDKNKVAPAQEGIPNSPEDRVDLSQESKEMKKIHAVLEMTPDIRNERVNELKKEVDEGRYQVNNQGVADKMIRESLFELTK